MNCACTDAGGRVTEACAAHWEWHRAFLSERLNDVIAKLLPRLPPEWAGDTLAMLELAEKLKTPGCLTQTWHHDSRGQVNSVKHTPEWHRQAKRRSA